MGAEDIACQKALALCPDTYRPAVGIIAFALMYDVLSPIPQFFIDYADLFKFRRTNAASLDISAVDLSCENALNIRYIQRLAVMRSHALIVELVRYGVRSHILKHSHLEYSPYIRRFFIVYNEIADFKAFLVEPAALYELIPERNYSFCENPFLNKLAHSRPYTFRSLCAFSGSLPEPYVIHQLINVIIETLFALLNAPNLDTLLNEPFDHKRRFIINTPDTVKHKDEENIELLIDSVLFELLNSISLVGVNL